MQLTNRTERVVHYRMGIEGLPGLFAEDQPDVAMAPGEAKSMTVTLALPPSSTQGLPPGAQPVVLTLTEPGRSEPALREKTTFLVPR